LVYLIGAVMMFYNLFKTAKQGSFEADEPAEAPALSAVLAQHANEKEDWHKRLERKPVKFLIWSIIAVAIGGLVEIIPTMIVKSNVPTIASVKPYTPLELEGRDIYVKEGCYNCHSQMIRPLRFETARYGDYSKAGEFVYDHPFQWGSKRTGPDLAREGGLRSDYWHYQHMIRPKDVTPGSIMPAYPWLKENDLDVSLTEKKIRAMQKLGVPYETGYDLKAMGDLQKQAKQVATRIVTDIFNKLPKELQKDFNKDAEIAKMEKKEIVALIAYLQRLGTDIKVK